MKFRSYILILLFGLILIFGRCSSPENVGINAVINPNGDSELALLMREMTKEIGRIKAQIEADETVDFKASYEKILTA